MKTRRWLAAVTVVALLVMVFIIVDTSVLFIALLKNPQKADEGPEAPPRIQVLEEIFRIGEACKRTKLRPQKLSETLDKMIDEDPDWVLVCLGTAYAREFPGITEQQEAEVFSKAEDNAREGLELLRKHVYDNTTARIKDNGQDPEKIVRQGWHNNNGSTALLLIDVPISERLGIKKQMLKEELGPINQGFDGWIKNVPGNYGDWWHGGQWPWKEEDPPPYWN